MRRITTLAWYDPTWVKARGPQPRRIGNVTYGKNPPVAPAAQRLVSGDTRRTRLDVPRRQVKRREIGLAARRDEQMSAFDPRSI